MTGTIDVVKSDSFCNLLQMRELSLRPAHTRDRDSCPTGCDIPHAEERRPLQLTVLGEDMQRIATYSGALTAPIGFSRVVKRTDTSLAARMQRHNRIEVVDCLTGIANEPFVSEPEF
jgi:hypothetical protein